MVFILFYLRRIIHETPFLLWAFSDRSIATMNGMGIQPMTAFSASGVKSGHSVKVYGSRVIRDVAGFEKGRSI